MSGQKFNLFKRLGKYLLICIFEETLHTYYRLMQINPPEIPEYTRFRFPTKVKVFEELQQELLIFSDQKILNH